jgi:HK97 family phage major capsid protein
MGAEQATTSQGIEAAVPDAKVEVQAYTHVLQTMKELNDVVLPNLKTMGERVEANEKQLVDAQRILDKFPRDFPVFGENASIQRDIFYEGMPIKAVHDALYSKTKDDVVKEWQIWCDRIKIHCGLTGKRPYELNIFKDYEGFIEKTGLGKALTVVGSPANWIPEGWSEDIITYYQQALRVVDLFETFEMPQDPFYWPFIGTGIDFSLRGEPTDNPASEIQVSDPSQDVLTLSTKEYAGHVRVTRTMEEDAIPLFVPRLRERVIPRGLAETEEDVIVNGDTASIHQDTVVTSSSDHRKGALGIRADAIDEGATYDITTGSTVFTYSDFIQVLKKHNNGLGVEATEGAWIMGNGAYLESTDFDRVSNNAQLVNQMISPSANGIVNIIHGRPVVVSGKYPETLTSAGLNDGAGSKSGFTHVNRVHYLYGTRRNETLEQFYDPRTGVRSIIVTKRAIFKKTLPSGNITAASGINV